MGTCPNCQVPVALDVNYCSNCGAALTATLAVSAPMPSLTRTSALTPPREPQEAGIVVMLEPKRSPWIAGYLEVFLPGIGMLYAGQIERGIVVNATTILLTIYAVWQYFADLLYAIQHVQIGLLGGMYVDYSGTNTFLGWAIALALLWLGIRIKMATDDVATYNRSVASAKTPVAIRL